MTAISPGWLIALYLIGWIPMMYIGAWLNNRAWKHRYKIGIHKAYERGWNHGFGFFQRIGEARTERMSSVKIKDPIS